MTTDTHTLLTTIAETKHACILLLNNVISVAVLETGITCIQEGKSVEFYIGKENKQQFEQDPILFNRCCQFVAAGGRIFILADTVNNNPYLWKANIDFTSFIAYTYSDKLLQYKAYQDRLEFDMALKEIKHEITAATPYLVEKGDIQIRFSVSDTFILNGDAVELRWEVDGAETIIIQGLGEVNAYGKKSIYLDKDTIIKIGASNKLQSQLKALRVEVADANLDIVYDIGFIHPKHEVYTSLVNLNNHPHIYGVAKGNQVKISWSVPHATAVHILPFEIKECTGTYLFTPTESLEIEIRAEIKNRIFRRKIQVLLFPIPVFKEKLVSLQWINDTAFKIETPEFPFQTAQQFLEVEKKKYQILIEKMNVRKVETGQKINLKNVEDSFFTQLKNRYFKKKHIVTELTTLQNIYEQSRTESESTSL